MTRAQTQQTLRQLPVKWALALLAIIVLYAFAQPALNSRLGLNLPSLARLMGEPEPKKPEAKKTESKKPEPKKSEAKKPDSKKSVADESDAVDSQGTVGNNSDNSSLTSTQESTSTADQSKSSSSNKELAGTKSNATLPGDTQRKTQPPNPPAEPKTKAAASDSTLLYGILKETGRDRYVSIEGLQYNPGSEEGHRLKHLEKHLKDIPDRPGKHGVFDGEMKDALKWIDDAYARGKRGAKGVHKSEEDNRTIYEVPFTQPIGYIGGRDGKRTGNPPAKRLRLVVEGSKFITAFPF